MVLGLSACLSSCLPELNRPRARARSQSDQKPSTCSSSVARPPMDDLPMLAETPVVPYSVTDGRTVETGRLEVPFLGGIANDGGGL